MPITVQQLAVSQYLDNERRQAIRYAPGSLADCEGQAPLPIHHPVHLDRVTATIDQVRALARRLTDLAADGQQRGTVDVAVPAAKLAQLIIPSSGLVGLVGPDWHPQLDLAGDIGGDIPWEVLEEHYAMCRCQGQTIQSFKPGMPPPPCPNCYQPMECFGGKLAIERHLTQLVRYSRRCPLGQGRDFLMVIDPTGDLLTGEADPTGACREHVNKLGELLEGSGFRVIKVQRKFATVDKIESELKSPTLVGMYYFGHGEPPERKQAGSLVLADGRLFADDIAGLDATPRIIFLNACWGGRGGSQADWDNRPSGVGEALARGGRKVVVASLFPVVTVQAARTAVTFFQHALAGEPLAVALQYCRRESYARYAAGEPDVGWMAYRYFGDPNQLLPKAELPPSAAAAISAAPSLFDDTDRLIADQFGCDMRAVLLRAASRRQRQQRGKVTLLDIFAGLLRVGQLVRLCWRDQKRDADMDYENLRVAPDRESTPALADSNADEPADPSERLWELISQWIVRQKAEFSPSALELFEHASRIAATDGRASGDGRVTEFDLLQALCSPEFAPHLPAFDATLVSTWLERFRRQKLFDPNGYLRLDDLQPGARRIIERAHELAQQRGQKYIPSRLLLAAFLIDADGVGARLARQSGANPERLQLLLIAITKGETPEEFPLSLESCGRIVLPTLKESGLSHTTQVAAPISEEELFRAFCRIAPPELKQLFHPSHSPIHLDLDLLATLSLCDEPIVPLSPLPPSPRPARPVPLSEPVKPLPARGSSNEFERFDEGGRRALATAAEFARAQGSREIRSPHLFAGLLTRPGLLAETFEDQQITAGEAIAAAIGTVVPQSLRPGSERQAVHISENVSNWIQSAEEVAEREGASRIGERHLTMALFAAPSQILQQVLGHFRIQAPAEPARDPDLVGTPKVNLSARNWDLTALARRGALPKFVPRDDLLQAFMRRLAPSSARVALVGRTGVGKSSLAHGLAQAIAMESCDADLRDCRVIELSAREMSGQGRFPVEGWARLQTGLASMPDDAVVFLDELIPGWLPAQEVAQFDWQSCRARVAVVTEAAHVAEFGLQNFDLVQVPAAVHAVQTMVEEARTALEQKFKVEIPLETAAYACEQGEPLELPGSAIQMLIEGCRRLVSEVKEKRRLSKEILEFGRSP